MEPHVGVGGHKVIGGGRVHPLRHTARLHPALTPGTLGTRSRLHLPPHGLGTVISATRRFARATASVWLAAACGPADSPRSADVAPPVEQRTADQPPRLEIGYVMGEATAPVEVVEFSDFGCSSCADFAVQTLPALRREFIEPGLVRWRFVPIRQGFLHGEVAATAAECAAAQDHFWPMHDMLAERQKEWQSRRDPTPLFADYAAEMELDPDRFQACLREKQADSSLGLHDMVALSLGIRGTPTFLAGGQRIFGALETERFARILREAVAAQQRPGTSRHRLP